jgi:hypothetical protein
MPSMQENAMAEQAKEESAAPDPARSYERAKPEAEAGMGRLDNDEQAVPTDRPDQMPDAVKHAQRPRQLNAHEVINESESVDPARSMPPPYAVDHSMLDEEPDGWDQAPTDIKNPREKRHPRKEGKGGTR